MIKKCKICGREFECYDKPKVSHHCNRTRRPFRAVTCSRRCSAKL